MELKTEENKSDNLLREIVGDFKTKFGYRPKTESFPLYDTDESDITAGAHQDKASY